MENESKSVKSAPSKLYFCSSAGCRVVMFKPDREVHEVCPSCGAPGVLLREATAKRRAVSR